MPSNIPYTSGNALLSTCSIMSTLSQAALDPCARDSASSSCPNRMRPRRRRNDASVSSGSGPVRRPSAGSEHTTSQRAHGPANGHLIHGGPEAQASYTVRCLLHVASPASNYSTLSTRLKKH